MFGVVSEYKYYREKSRAEALQKELNSLQVAYNALLENASSEIADAKLVIDFSKINAFSIERTFDSNQRPITSIGYLLDEETVEKGDKITYASKVKEWRYYCSIERHDELIDEFQRKTYKEI